MSEEQVIHALNVIYSNSSSSNDRETANKWLTEWKETTDVNSWNICFSLLQNTNYPTLVHHFSALCLRHFVCSNKHWALLSQDKYSEMLRLIISMIISNIYSNDINKELTYSICGIGIRTFSTDWPTFFIDLFYLLHSQDCYNHYLEERKKQLGGTNNPEDFESFSRQKSGECTGVTIKSLLLQNFSDNEKKQLMLPALQILTYLPEQIDSFSSIYSRSKIENITFNCKVRSPAVLYLVQKFLRLEGSPKKLLITCILNWSNFILHPQISIDTGILSRVVDGIKSVDYSNEYSQIFVQLLYHQDWKRFPNVGLDLIKHISTFLEYFKDKKDDNRIKSIAICVSTLIDMFTGLVVDHLQDGGGNLLELALFCTSQNDQEVFSIMLDVWYSILYHIEEIENESLLIYFNSLYQRLFKILLTHCMIEDSDSWDDDDQTEFDELRILLIDSFQYCHTVLTEQYFVELLSLFDNCLKDSSTNWEKYEALIYSFSVVGECIEENCYKYIQPIFERIFHISNPPYRLANTILLAIKEYAEYLSTYPNCLSKSYDYIKIAVKNQLLVKNATKALADICKYCDDSLVPHYEQIYSSFYPLLQTLQASEKSNIVEGLARLIGKQPISIAYNSLTQLLTPIGKDIHQLINKQNMDEQTVEAIHNNMELLCSICVACKFELKEEIEWDKLCKREIESSHPLIKSFVVIWPVVINICKKFPNNPEIAEYYTRLIKNLVIATRSSFALFLRDTADIYLNYLKANTNEIFFTSAPWLFTSFTNINILNVNPVITTVLSELLINFTELFTQILNTCVNPLIIRGYYIFMNKIYSTIPQLLFSIPKVINTSIKVAINAIPIVSHIGSLKSVLSYIELYLSQKPAQFKNITDMLIPELCPAFIYIFLDGIAGKMTRQAIMSATKTFFIIQSKFLQNIRPWVAKELEKITNSNLSKNDKMKFLNAICKKQSRESLSLIIMDLFKLCRGQDKVIFLS